MIPLDVRLNNFLGTVEFVADEQTHRAVWLEGATGITSITSLGELYCQFFDDNDMDSFINEELSNAPLSPPQKEAIVRFRTALGAVETLPSYKDHNDRETIASREWKALVQCARETLRVFARPSE